MDLKSILCDQNSADDLERHIRSKAEPVAASERPPDKGMTFLPASTGHGFPGLESFQTVNLNFHDPNLSIPRHSEYYESNSRSDQTQAKGFALPPIRSLGASIPNFRYHQTNGVHQQHFIASNTPVQTSLGPNHVGLLPSSRLPSYPGEGHFQIQMRNSTDFQSQEFQGKADRYRSSHNTQMPGTLTRPGEQRSKRSTSISSPTSTLSAEKRQVEGSTTSSRKKKKSQFSLLLQHDGSPLSDYYSEHNKNYMEKIFETNMFPSTEEKISIAESLQITPRSVHIWFQNRRHQFKVEARAKGFVVPSGRGKRGDLNQEAYLRSFKPPESQ